MQLGQDTPLEEPPMDTVEVTAPTYNYLWWLVAGAIAVYYVFNKNSHNTRHHGKRRQLASSSL